MAAAVVREYDQSDNHDTAIATTAFEPKLTVRGEN